MSAFKYRFQADIQYKLSAIFVKGIFYKFSKSLFFLSIFILLPEGQLFSSQHLYRQTYYNIYTYPCQEFFYVFYQYYYT
jgi:hypothetical protein